jgi:hypothetical protein
VTVTCCASHLLPGRSSVLEVTCSDGLGHSIVVTVLPFLRLSSNFFSSFASFVQLFFAIPFTLHFPELCFFASHCFFPSHSLLPSLSFSFHCFPVVIPCSILLISSNVSILFFFFPFLILFPFSFLPCTHAHKCSQTSFKLVEPWAC